MVAAFRRERAGNTYGVIPAISGLIVCRVSEGLSEAILDDGRRGGSFPLPHRFRKIHRLWPDPFKTAIIRWVGFPIPPSEALCFIGKYYIPDVSGCRISGARCAETSAMRTW